MENQGKKGIIKRHRKSPWSGRNERILSNGRYSLVGTEKSWKGLKSIIMEKKRWKREGYGKKNTDIS